MKHRSGNYNRVIDSLSRRKLLLTILQIEVVGFKELMNLYPKDLDFAEHWKACTIPITLDRTKWLDLIIQDGMFFKGSQLYIPKSSMRENLIKEKHRVRLVGHFGQDKTFALIFEHYY